VIDNSAFDWKHDKWRAPALEDYVIYEVHIGTFTAEGTFESAIGQLDLLVDLGVTAVEIMPVAQFPGERNWGYDGVFPFAAQSSYGGARGLAQLVDACHERGMAVILDVVYNHFGPEGAYIAATGDYLTAKYHTPWGAAVNFDGPGCDEVRRFFIESALYWLRDLRIDALRLDAVHAIVDHSPDPFLRQFASEIHHAARELGRTAVLIAECAQIEARVLQPPSAGGYGFNAQWCDDVHHALHAALTGESTGYYHRFGSTKQIAQALQCGFVADSQVSRPDRRSLDVAREDVRPSQVIVCSQNHDQIGNRAVGDRLTATLDFEQLKLAAATIMLSPFTPLLFMGEEYGETAPFQYFTSHADARLIEAVRRGRREEFKSFAWSGDLPDPQDCATFERSKLRAELRDTERGRTLEAFYREAIRLRRDLPALRQPDFSTLHVELAGLDDSVIVVRRHNGNDAALILLNYARRTEEIHLPEGDWFAVLDSAGPRWGGSFSEPREGRCYRTGDRVRLAPSSALLLRQPGKEVA
jgi:maltooligosyltrehalose trehalohydrolase